MPGSSTATTGAFRIGYQGTDPALVMAALRTSIKADLYVEQNLRTMRGQQAAWYRVPRRVALAMPKGRPRRNGNRVSALYKLEHNGELPQQRIYTVWHLIRLQIELEANRDAINRTQQTR